MLVITSEQVSDSLILSNHSFKFYLTRNIPLMSLHIIDDYVSCSEKMLILQEPFSDEVVLVFV